MTPPPFNVFFGDDSNVFHVQPFVELRQLCVCGCIVGMGGLKG